MQEAHVASPALAHSEAKQLSAASGTSDTETVDERLAALEPLEEYSLEDILTKAHGLGIAFTPLRRGEGEERKWPSTPEWQKQPPLPLDNVLSLSEGGGLAVRTGSLSGVVAVDVDPRNKGVVPHGLPKTLTVLTPSGGAHFYFSVSKDHPFNAAQYEMPVGVDLQGENKLAVFPGSPHPNGGVYKFALGLSLDDVSIAPFPKSLFPKRPVFTSQTKPVQRTTASRNGHANGNEKAYAEAALDGECNNVRNALDGVRNYTLNNSSCSMGGFVGVLEEDVIVEALADAARDSGLTNAEIYPTIRSGLNKGKESPRDIPEQPATLKRSTWGLRETAMDAQLADIENKIPNDAPIRNFELVRTGSTISQKLVPQAIPLPEISREAFAITGGFPKRVGKALFVDDQGTVRFLADHNELFAYFGEMPGGVHWKGGGSLDNAQLTPKKEFFAHLSNVAENFEQVEVLPHEPLIEGFYYAWRAPTNYKPTGEYLDTLLSFFDNYETEHDRALIRALFLTLFSGCKHGARPLFSIIARGQGQGKSKLKDAARNLCGGIEVDATGKGDDQILKRLLSPEGRLARALCIDNVKNRKASAFIESLITQEYLSGQELYKGEGRRPNTLTYILTGNALQLSRDLAARSFIIRLKEPTPKHGWDEALSNHIRDHREYIIADIVDALKATPAPHGGHDRWQPFVDNILPLCTADPLGVIALNQARRDDSDEDVEEAANIMAALRRRHANGVKNDYDSGFNPNFIHSSDMMALVNSALNLNLGTGSVTTRVKGHIEGGRLPGVTRHRITGGRQGFKLSNISEASEG